ncbi:MAG: hypothetical protein ABIP51_11230 [Bacteroidia bacterium]
MKKRITNTLAVILLIASFTSCKTSVKKEIIETYKVENAFYEKDLEDKVNVKDQLIEETERNFNEFVNDIDPKKKNNFEKDPAQTEISNKKSCIVELAEEFQVNNDSLQFIINISKVFLASLESTKLKEEEAAKQWNRYKTRMQSFQSKSDSLSIEMTNVKTDTYELYHHLITKYGNQNTDRTNKKSKKK